MGLIRHSKTISKTLIVTVTVREPRCRSDQIFTLESLSLFCKE